ncbi:hypothetical protein HYALB_00007865 [Hymenoscyphus albidus]|uniref:Peptidase S33 tripeptidyl aminopeptidase-like C-terminal domain-containing protein n=1 Tax=Hymenoscyphus albidus TaxID=595503 RepID=A0A9N9LI44_9HELO|nr:hypothetical protein HYALB_00007865 [Hymenoscyphus albidus]
MLDVPLDYQNQTSDAPRAYIALMKYPATDPKDYKGMILLNPGGPGGSGVQFAATMGPIWSDATETIGPIGPNFDIIGFDPRGVGFSIPSANCTYSLDLPIGKRFDQPNGPILDMEGFARELPEIEKLLRSAKLCEKAIGGSDGAGQYMSTATVARDIVSITDAFAATSDGQKVKNPKLTNYLGISYGSFLGQTFASMFPERVGRFLLSGVVDPDDIVTGLPMRHLQSLDETFAGFFVYCSLAEDGRCDYARGDSPRDIFLRFENILARLDINKARANKWKNVTLIEEVLYTMKKTIFDAAYLPREMFPKVAEGLLSLEKAMNNRTPFEELEDYRNRLVAFKFPQEWYNGNMCSDQNGIMRNVTVQEIWPLVSTLQHQSYIGGDVYLANWFACLGWSIVPKEVYQGPFGGPTETPILFVGNSWDPVTPIYNALKGGNIFTQAGVLTVNEPGHSVWNPCATKKIRAYFKEGTMPGSDNFCIGTEPGQGVFNTTLKVRLEENEAWREIVQRLRELRLKSWKAHT